MSYSPGPSSCHTTYTFVPSAVICGFVENPKSVRLIGTGTQKVSPLFVLRLKKISAPSLDCSSHTTYTLGSTAAILGNAENPEDVGSVSASLISPAVTTS